MLAGKAELLASSNLSALELGGRQPRIRNDVNDPLLRALQKKLTSCWPRARNDRPRVKSEKNPQGPLGRLRPASLKTLRRRLMEMSSKGLSRSSNSGDVQYATPVVSLGPLPGLNVSVVSLTTFEAGRAGKQNLWSTCQGQAERGSRISYDF